jgi:hypothetical protein
MAATEKATEKRRLQILKWLGCGLICHFVFVLGRSTYLGVPENVLWICHLGTLIGGLGVCLQNRRLISLALVICFGHHAFWAFDTLTWLITGGFAVGATAYVQNHSLGGWIQSANHFFLVPVLVIAAVIQGGIDKYAWIWSSLLFLVLIATSLFLLPPASNVNCAHRPWPGTEPLILRFVPSDPFSSVRYVLFITAATVFGNYLPTNLVLGYAVSKCVRGAGYRRKITG